MKEYPDPNWGLRLYDLVGQHAAEPALARFMDGCWELELNYCVSIRFLPYLPTSPWPPPVPDDIDSASDLDGAMRILYTTSFMVATPTDGPERIEDLVAHLEGFQTVFWIARGRYARLEADLALLHRLPYVSRGLPPRLDDFPDGELERFLRNDLPRAAALTDYGREILCLTPR